MSATTSRHRTRAVAAALAGAAALSVSGGALAASAAAAPSPAPLDPLGLVTSLLGPVLNGVLPTVTSLPATLVQTVSGLPLVNGLPLSTDAASKLLGGTDVVKTVLGAVGSPLDLVTSLLGAGGALSGIHISIG